MMKDADLKRNASGYYDETAYKAITAPPKAGEIWTSSDGRKCWLILQNHGTVCSTLLMGTEEKENSIKVMARVPMYTEPAMVGYTFTDFVSTFVKTVPAENMAEVRKAVGEALGITAAPENPIADVNLLKSDIKALSDIVASLREENDELKHENADLRSDMKIFEEKASALKVEWERDRKDMVLMNQEYIKLQFYKDMYMDLIDKLVAVRGGIVND